MRTSAEIQRVWLDVVSKRTKQFLKQLPKAKRGTA